MKEEEEEGPGRSSSASMLRAVGMEEFVTEDEEPWYDQRDLEQGETSPPLWDETMPRPQAVRLIHAGGGRMDGKTEGRRLHPFVKMDKSVCLCTYSVELPLPQLCSLFLPIILILSVVFPRIAPLSD